MKFVWSLPLGGGGGGCGVVGGDGPEITDITPFVCLVQALIVHSFETSDSLYATVMGFNVNGRELPLDNCTVLLGILIAGF